MTGLFLLSPNACVSKVRIVLTELCVDTLRAR